jgi:DNA-binding NarL/FixJ family response regulator
MVHQRPPRKVTITDREKEVLSYLTDGYSNEETAQMMVLSSRTVEAHRARIMLKLNIHDLAGLVKYAIVNEITSMDKHRSFEKKIALPPANKKKK